MEKVLIKGYIVEPDGISACPRALLVENGLISGIRAESDLDPGGCPVYDFGSAYICPGFIDLHVHGSGGVDVMDGTPDAVSIMARSLAAGGTTAFLATTMTASRDKLLSVIENLAGFRGKETGGAEVIGIHMEGPFLNSAQKGAQAKKNIRIPDIAEFMEFADLARGALRMMTIAPELPGSLDVIRLAADLGCTMALGHSAASYGQVSEACLAGLRHVTHTFNAMGPFHHRDLGTAGAAMVLEQLTADVIPDGFHVHPQIIRLLALAKGTERVCAVTDCMRAGGMGDGVYELGGQTVTVRAGIARLSGGKLAGSTLSMARAVDVLVSQAGFSLNDAVQMAAGNPARILGLSSKGVLGLGMDADIVVLDRSFRVLLTMVGGKIVQMHTAD